MDTDIDREILDGMRRRLIEDEIQRTCWCGRLDCRLHPPSANLRPALARLCIAAAALADEELDYCEMRLLDRTGARHVATLRRMGELMHAKAWCQRHIHPVAPPRVTGHGAFGHDSVDAIPF